MTNSVTFPVDLGGDGSTVTDDDNASTGLGNGGHRTRFVPAMGQVVAVANVLTQRLSSQSDTSSSSIAIGTGSKSFVTAGFYEWAIGMYVMASSAASASNWMYGQVTAWSTSTNTVTVNVVSSNGSGTYSDWVVSLAGPANLSTLPSTIDVSSTSAALRVTQRGSGNSLLIEDSTNPDSTPFVIASNGNVISGNTTAFAASTLTPGINFQGIGGSGNEPNTIGINAFGANSGGPVIYFGKSRGATVGTAGLVSDGDYFGALFFEGSDGVAQKRGASIVAQVDGTPGTNDMPGRLVFSTTADGASSSSEAMRIDSAGRVGIGGTPSAGRTLTISANITGSTAGRGCLNNGTIQSDVTSNAYVYVANPATAAAAFTLPTLGHFYANQGTIGAGSAITSQYGFLAESSLTGATNNYGFYSNIASGTGRYNFYAAGTAANYFAGQILLAANRELVIGGTDTANNPQLFSDGTYFQLNAPNASGDIRFRVAGSERMKIDSAGRVIIGPSGDAGTTLALTKTLTGATSATGTWLSASVLSDVTTNAFGFRTNLGTQASSFTLPSLAHNYVNQAAFGAGSTVTNQYGFLVESSLTGATNNYGFYTNIASGSNRYNFYAAGTADNYFAGAIKGNTTIAGGYAALAQNTQAVALGSRKVTYVDVNSAPVFTTTVSPAGSTATLIVYNSNASTVTIAWGAGFKTQGNISATALKTYTISFVSDGTTMIETSRTTGM